MKYDIQIKKIGYCAYKHYDNYVLGAYSLRTMRNGVQDIAFYGFLVGKSGFNPYCYIMRTSLLEFEKDKFKIQEELYLSLETRLETLYQTITTIVNSLLESSITIGDLAYACRSEYGSFTLGKQLESSSYYEILFIQQRCDGITIKIKKCDPFGAVEYHKEDLTTSMPVNLYEGIKKCVVSQADEIIKRLTQ